MNNQINMEIKAPICLYQQLKKMILQQKIAEEMRQYQDDMKWEQYQANRITEDIKIGLLHN